MSLTYRAIKGTKLTTEEGDENFSFLFCPYINFYDVASASVTSGLTIDTWAKLNTTTVEGFTNDGLIHTNNRVTFTGLNPITGLAEPRVFHITGALSVFAGNNENIHVALFKNGSIITESEQETTMSAAGKGQSLPFFAVVELTATDYIEVWVKNETSAGNITLSRLAVIVKAVQWDDLVS